MGLVPSHRHPSDEQAQHLGTVLGGARVEGIGSKVRRLGFKGGAKRNLRQDEGAGRARRSEEGMQGLVFARLGPQHLKVADPIDLANLAAKHLLLHFALLELLVPVLSPVFRDVRADGSISTATEALHKGALLGHLSFELQCLAGQLGREAPLLLHLVPDHTQGLPVNLCAFRGAIVFGTTVPLQLLRLLPFLQLVHLALALCEVPAHLLKVALELCHNLDSFSCRQVLTADTRALRSTGPLDLLG
mmetsp:Transcript_73107/g.161732  ORF Transcript_73107/g.161732 Transcript_73107/m.161732 type:complete len:246 (+) Transcript_73107:150-887(+)